MQKITIILATLIALIFTGCGGSMYHYEYKGDRLL